MNQNGVTYIIMPSAVHGTSMVGTKNGATGAMTDAGSISDRINLYARMPYYILGWMLVI